MAITITRPLARQLRSVMRCAFGNFCGHGPALGFIADADTLSVRAKFADVAVECPSVVRHSRPKRRNPHLDAEEVDFAKPHRHKAFLAFSTAWLAAETRLALRYLLDRLGRLRARPDDRA